MPCIDGTKMNCVLKGTNTWEEEEEEKEDEEGEKRKKQRINLEKRRHRHDSSRLTDVAKTNARLIDCPSTLTMLGTLFKSSITFSAALR